VIQLDKILQKLCTIKSDIIICGDVNVNYLQESDKKSQLNALLNSYNLFSIVQFPTRTYNNSSSAIDNIFIDTTKIDTYEAIRVINGLSDYDAQITNLNTSYYNNNLHEYQTISEETLINTPWQNFKTAQAMKHGIKFLTVMTLIKYLRILYASFPLKKLIMKLRHPGK